MNSIRGFEFLPKTARTMNRRSLILGALGAAAVGGAVPRARAAEKMSKVEAEYQDSPKDIRMCATCTLFEPPRACKVVQGEVSPYGWCKAFALAD
jgi:hypothetical protein